MIGLKTWDLLLTTISNDARVQIEDLNIFHLVATASAVPRLNSRLASSRDDNFISRRDVVTAVTKTTQRHIWTWCVHFGCQIQEISFAVIIRIRAPSASKEHWGPIQQKFFWLEFWFEKSLEFWLEIPHTKKMFRNG